MHILSCYTCVTSRLVSLFFSRYNFSCILTLGEDYCLGNGNIAQTCKMRTDLGRREEHVLSNIPGTTHLLNILSNHTSFERTEARVRLSWARTQAEKQVCVESDISRRVM